jgi:hypothetical protein
MVDASKLVNHPLHLTLCQSVGEATMLSGAQSADVAQDMYTHLSNSATACAFSCPLLCLFCQLRETDWFGAPIQR